MPIPGVVCTDSPGDGSGRDGASKPETRRGPSTPGCLGRIRSTRCPSARKPSTNRATVTATPLISGG